MSELENFCSPFHDFTLGQERLAAAIQKQNEEIRSLSQGLLQMEESLKQFYASVISDEEFEDGNEQEAVSMDEATQVLIDAMDAVWNLFKGSQNIVQTILSIVPEKIGFWWNLKESSTAPVEGEPLEKSDIPNGPGFWHRCTPPWRSLLEEVLKGYSDGIQIMQKKMSLSLNQIGITLICPELKAPFNPQMHRAIKTIEGGKKGMVTEIIRCGYLRNGEVLRHAEVIIY
jgi:hypothetical protein